MKVVVDTNVLMVSISDRSPLHWIFQGFLEYRYTLCVTTDILTEYAEVIERKMGHSVSENILAILERRQNVERVNTCFRFLMIPNDADDNIFVDCAISAGAYFIVTHDTHFNILKQIPFPKAEVIDTIEFYRRLFS